MLDYCYTLRPSWCKKLSISSATPYMFRNDGNLAYKYQQKGVVKTLARTESTSIRLRGHPRIHGCARQWLSANAFADRRLGDNAASGLLRLGVRPRRTYCVHGKLASRLKLTLPTQRSTRVSSQACLRQAQHGGERRQGSSRRPLLDVESRAWIALIGIAVGTWESYVGRFSRASIGSISHPV